MQSKKNTCGYPGRIPRNAYPYDGSSCPDLHMSHVVVDIEAEFRMFTLALLPVRQGVRCDIVHDDDKLVKCHPLEEFPG